MKNLVSILITKKTLEISASSQSMKNLINLNDNFIQEKKTEREKKYNKGRITHIMTLKQHNHHKYII